jgi:hypothetical protein
VRGDKLSATLDLKPLLAVARKSRWLADFAAMALQQACIDLDRAFVFALRSPAPRSAVVRLRVELPQLRHTA